MAKTAKNKVTTKRQIGALTYGSLQKFNLGAALLLAVQGILVLIFSSSKNGLKPISTSFITDDKAAGSIAGHPVLASASQHLFNLNLAYLVAAFFFISALAYLTIATWKRKAYELDLGKGVNRARWIEYAFSAGIMVAAVATLAGVLDFMSLVMVFALTAAMSLLGLNMELRNQNENRVDWASYYIGVFAGLVPWIVIAYYIWSSSAYGSGVPVYVYWIFGSLLVLFAGFALNMYFQYKKIGHWSNYLFGERAYIILSFVAKTALAWQVFAGTLKP